MYGRICHQKGLTLEVLEVMMPSNNVLNTSHIGPTVFAIPLKDVFFFIAQTYHSAAVIALILHRRLLPGGDHRVSYAESCGYVIVAGFFYTPRQTGV